MYMVIFLKSYWSNKCVVPLTVTVFEASFLIICLLTEKMDLHGEVFVSETFFIGDVGMVI